MSSPSKRGVLVVEDLDDTRELVAEFLMQQGYHSIMASNGAEALERLAEIRPDVIVSDLDMPEMGGAEFVRRMDADPLTKSIPIILVTGSGRSKATEELGAHAGQVRTILLKPIRLSDLQDAIEAALAAEDST